MDAQQYFTLKEVKLNNNCPECYSNEGLKLTFKQKFVENAFYKAITQDIINDMHCCTCDTAIFPVRWTDNIEQVVAYQKRAIQVKPNSLKLKKITWFLLIASVMLVTGLVLVATGILNFG